MRKLNKKFYLRDNVVEIAKDLIGKTLYTNLNGIISGGIIVETEAYDGRRDKACHAYPNKLTKRTSIMYQGGGIAYVYLCYGIHKMFNVVTNKDGFADAVLIRSIEPTLGLDIMEDRRNVLQNKKALSSGPGNLCKAMGIELAHNGIPLLENVIWIEEDENTQPEIESCKRVGVDYAEEDKDLPWRFILKGNKWVSKLNLV